MVGIHPQWTVLRNNISLGKSKIGGYPDFPKNMNWPKGKDCNILYDDDETTEDIEEPNTGDVGSDEETVDIITTEQIQVELESEDNLEVVGERNEEDKGCLKT